MQKKRRGAGGAAGPERDGFAGGEADRVRMQIAPFSRRAFPINSKPRPAHGVVRLLRFVQGWRLGSSCLSKRCSVLHGDRPPSSKPVHAMKSRGGWVFERDMRLAGAEPKTRIDSEARTRTSRFQVQVDFLSQCRH